jgi:hypothetical protein
VDSGVIAVRKFCVPGEMCYGYRLCPPHDQGFSHYQPTTKRLVTKIMAWRTKEFREVRLPLHRDLRRYVKAIRIDEEAALARVHGSPFQRSAQIAMIERIVLGDYFTVADRFGRFHTNLTSLKATLRPFLRYRGSPLVNLDIANSQPMVFCLLLVNLLSNEKQLENLIDYTFPETSQPYHIEIDQDYLDSLHSPDFQEEEGEGDGTLLYSMQIVQFRNITPSKTMTCNELLISKLLYSKTTKKKKRKREGDGTLLYSMQMSRLIVATSSKQTTCNRLIIGKLLYSKTTKKKRREGTGTLLYSMQMSRLIVATSCKTMTCNRLIIGKLINTKTTKKKRREREGDGTLLYSMQMIKILNIT